MLRDEDKGFTPMSAVELPISYLVRVDDIPPSGLDVALAPNDAERALLSKFLDVPALPVLGAKFNLRRKGHRVTVTGDISGDVTRICVVSLDEFPMIIKEHVTMVFDETADPAAEVSEDEHDAPEPLIGGVIDLGAILCEFTALGLDPYPKKPGAVFAFHDDGERDENPFAALSALKSQE